MGPSPPVDDPASGRLAAKLASLPARAGVYRFRNAAGETIYVGKAKSLRSRVRSYFRAKATHSPHIARMVSELSDLDLIVVDTEMEALILESNLIKEERPRYNVVLRDDKSFPYLKISVRDPYPRASLVRRPRQDGSAYVGPFLPASSARRTLKLVQSQFRVATCKEVFDGKRRPCLYYHLDQCLAPCAGKTTPEEYGRAVEDARLFLDGRHADLEASLEERMQAASRAQEYERALAHRETLRTVRALSVKQRMLSVGLEEQDYIAHHAEAGELAVQLFQVRQGRVQGRRELVADGAVLDGPELYASILTQVYAGSEPPPEVYLPELPRPLELFEHWLCSARGSRVRLRVPRRGPKQRLLELVRANARLAFEARFRGPTTHGVELLQAVAAALDLDEPPYRIECFDISNLHGADSVASLVVWEGGKPKRSDYRIFTIRQVEGPDDTASIAEAVSRRYRRLLAEDRRLPDLVLIDGGRGQLSAAVAALAHVGLPMLAVAALAKQEEEIHLPGRTEPIRLDRSSPVLQLVQRVRDEAHRFALSRHRARRSRRTLRTELVDIPGIGPARARKLLREFGSLAGVRRAGLEALARAVGRRAAEAILARWPAERG